MTATTTAPVWVRFGDGPPCHVGDVTIDHVDGTPADLLTRYAALLRAVADQVDPPASLDPVTLREAVGAALAVPVPCPRCRRTAACRCGGDRRPGRAAAVTAAVLAHLGHAQAEPVEAEPEPDAAPAGPGGASQPLGWERQGDRPGDRRATRSGR